MKPVAIGIGVLTLVLMSGSGSDRWAVAAQRPDAQSPRYVARDTGEWDCGGIGGSFGTLYENGKPVDTIDLGFGVQVVPSGVLFLPMVRTTGGDPQPGHAALCPDVHVLYDGARRTVLHTIVPDFGEDWSGPAVLDSVLYYWGLVRDGQSWWYNVSTARYDFRTKESGSRPWGRMEFETDDPSFLARPIKRDGLILFRDGHGEGAWLTEQLEFVRWDPAHRWRVDRVGTFRCGEGGRESVAVGVVYDRAVLIDTIDATLGFHLVAGGGAVYRPVRGARTGGVRWEVPGACRAEYVVFDGRGRRKLNEFLPSFNDTLATPAVIDSVLYYWGLDLRDPASGLYAVSAVRYDLGSQQARRRGLGMVRIADSIAARTSFPLPRPLKAAGLIWFGPFRGGRVALNDRFEIVERTSTPD